MQIQDSLTLFPDTELYRMEREGKFTPAGEKERIEELQVFIKNLQIRTHLFANSSSNFYPVTAYAFQYPLSFPASPVI